MKYSWYLLLNASSKWMEYSEILSHDGEFMMNSKWLSDCLNYLSETVCDKGNRCVDSNVMWCLKKSMI